MKRNLFLLLMSFLTLSAMTITSCSKGDDGDGGGGTDDPITLTFDKTQYYPLDMVTVQFSETVQGDTYTGTIGGEAVTTIRLSETAFAFAMPDLPAGAHILSLEVGEQTAEGELDVVPLPTVDNPEQVIEEMEDYYVGVIDQIGELDEANEAFMFELAELLDEQIALMSDSERRKFAAYWQVHPELRPDWDEFVRQLEAGEPGTRTSLEEKSKKLLSYTLIWTATTAAIDASLVASTFSVGWAIRTWNPFTAGAAAVSVFSLTASFLANKYYGQRALNCAAFQVTSFMDILMSRAATDYTLSNGESLSFNARVTYRSVLAEDISNPAASEIVAADSKYTSVWGKLMEIVDSLREYTDLVSRPQRVLPEIASITVPKTETEAINDMTLQILSGNVAVEKTDGKSFTFTTASKEDVEFTFKLSADGIESRVFTGLLDVAEVDNTNLALGKWQSRDSFFSPTIYEVTLTFYANRGVTYTYHVYNETTGETIGEDINNSGTYTPVSDTDVDGAINGLHDYDGNPYSSYQLVDNNTLFLYDMIGGVPGVTTFKRVP